MHTFVVLAYKESNYLEACIQSVMNQEYKSKVIIATSTPNNYIENIAKKYNLDVIVNPNPGQGIGYDFDFAISVGKTNLVTVAHQDDTYEKNYSKKIVELYRRNQDSLIIFSDYYEIRKDGNVKNNLNLKIKRILLLPMKSKKLSRTILGKRLILRFGNSICCPAVTFVKDNLKTDDIFKCDLVCDIDWYAWEKLSKRKGKFTFVNECLMGHRIHEESTTTKIIGENVRTKEDLIMFNKFWPTWFSKLINRFYIAAEKSNR